MKTYSLLVALSILAMAGHSAYAYDHIVSDVPVGSIRVFGNYGGVQAFLRSDGAAFPGCTSDTVTMWVDSNYVTTDGAKVIAAALLMAKSTQSLVRVYYTTADGYCRFQIVEVE
jgi:hypothetical protein